MPANERAGILTNAGFLTMRAHSGGLSLVNRGIAIKTQVACTEIPPLPESANLEAESRAWRDLAIQTAQEQAAVRASAPSCDACHRSFDPYGLVLDAYDVVGRYRTVGDLGRPVDAHTHLPAEVGGGEVWSAVQTAETLAERDTFTNCMAKSMLRYALIDADVELPLPAENRAGCAAAAIAHDLRQSRARSFTDLFRAVATSPAFFVRKVETMASPLQDSAPRLAQAPAARAERSARAAAPPPADATLATLACRRSVFDFVAAEVDLLRRDVPAAVKVRLDEHWESARLLASAATTAIDARRSAPLAPDPRGSLHY